MPIRAQLLILALVLLPATAQAGWFGYSFGKPMPQQVAVVPGAAAVPAMDHIGLGACIGIMYVVLRRLRK